LGVAEPDSIHVSAKGCDFSRFKYLDIFQLDCFNGKKGEIATKHVKRSHCPNYSLNRIGWTQF